MIHAIRSAEFNRPGHPRRFNLNTILEPGVIVDLLADQDQDARPIKRWTGKEFGDGDPYIRDVTAGRVASSPRFTEYAKAMLPPEARHKSHLDPFSVAANSYAAAYEFIEAQAIAASAIADEFRKRFGDLASQPADPWPWIRTEMFLRLNALVTTEQRARFAKRTAAQRGRDAQEVAARRRARPPAASQPKR